MRRSDDARLNPAGTFATCLAVFHNDQLLILSYHIGSFDGRALQQPTRVIAFFRTRTFTGNSCQLLHNH